MDRKKRLTVHKVFVVTPQFTIEVLEDPTPDKDNERWMVLSDREYDDGHNSVLTTYMSTLVGAIADAESFHERCSIAEGKWLV